MTVTAIKMLGVLNTRAEGGWSGRSRRWVWCGVALIALLAACGSDGADDSAVASADVAVTVTSSAPADTPTDVSTAPPDTTAPEATMAPATAAPPDTSAGPETTASGACREVAHELGTSCVPSDPQRIVVLDTLMVLPTLLDAGASVVGSLSVYDVGDPFPSFVDTAGADIAIVGSLQTPNLELIAATQPDLIIGASIVMEPIRAELEALAPIVATKYAYYVPTWRDEALLVGEAAGVRDEVAASIVELDTRVAATRARLTAGRDGPELSRVDVFNGQPLYYEYACTAFGEVLTSAGIRQPAAQIADCAPDDYQSVLKYPSLEQLEVLDGDVIVTYQQQAGEGDVGASPLATLEASPLWATLAAVQAGQVHVVGDAWGLGASVPAFRSMLDDVDRLFP